MSCEEDSSSKQSRDAQEKDNTQISNNEKELDLRFELSQIELLTKKDSTSYIIGFKISKQFYKQSEFSSLNKTLICEGFDDEIGSYDKDSCISNISAYMDSEDARKDLKFANACARSIGRLYKDEFIKKIQEIDALDIFNDKMLSAGFSDGMNLKNVFENDQKSVDDLFARLNSILENKQLEAIQNIEKDGIVFLKTNRSKKGIKETPSGIQYKILRKGKGKYPSATSQVKVHYKGSLLSGEVFDSSYERREPSSFGLNQVIRGWTEGIQLMQPGSKFIFYIPHELGYGANPDPRSGIKPYSLLIFEVELIDIL